MPSTLRKTSVASGERGSAGPPATIGEAQELLGTDEALTPCQDERYAFFEIHSSYGNIPQRWILFQSRDMAEKEERTLEKRIDHLLADARKNFAKLSRIEYFCDADARSALDRFFAEHPLVWGEPPVEEERRKKRPRKGRPSSEEEMEVWYRLQGDLSLRQDAVKRLRSKLGRFLLADPDRTLSPEQLLDRYKEQGAVERGFRFLKDPAFRTSEVYLKKGERIEGLMFLMVLALLVYNLAEKDLRRALVETGKNVPSQTKKSTQKPTLPWIFQLFDRITEVTLTAGTTKSVTLAHVTDLHRPILSLLGEKCMQYYEDDPFCG